jgi:hypothetical protein
LGDLAYTSVPYFDSYDYSKITELQRYKYGLERHDVKLGITI